MTPTNSGARRDLTVIARICQDQRTPWFAKLVTARGIGYAFSPIQPVPDWIFALRQFNDMLVASLGVALLLKLTSADVARRRRAQASSEQGRELATMAGARVTAAVTVP